MRKNCWIYRKLCFAFVGTNFSESFLKTKTNGKMGKDLLFLYFYESLNNGDFPEHREFPLLTKGLREKGTILKMLITINDTV